MLVQAEKISFKREICRSVCSYTLCSFYHRLVEEADYRATAELFGVKDEEKNLDMFIPKSESDFLEYAEMISHKLKPFEVCCILSYTLLLLAI